MKTEQWDRRFIELVRVISTWSKDKSTKVGCVIVGSSQEIRATGYNGFPRGVNDEVAIRHERPEKYFWTEHSERNAIYNAARVGVPLEGCTIYVSWFPCMDCARAIIQSGIKRVVAASADENDPRWGEDFKRVKWMFSESQITFYWLDEEKAK